MSLSRPASASTLLSALTASTTRPARALNLRVAALSPAASSALCASTRALAAAISAAFVACLVFFVAITLLLLGCFLRDALPDSPAVGGDQLLLLQEGEHH